MPTQALPRWFDFGGALLKGKALGVGQPRKVSLGPLQSAPMGLGTWSWGNQILWGYSAEDDAEIQEVFNLVVSKGINIFDTADSYGTGRLNGQSEKLLGKFLQEYPGGRQQRKDVLIATKLAAYPWRIFPGQFVKACRSICSRHEYRYAFTLSHFVICHSAKWMTQRVSSCWSDLAMTLTVLTPV